MSAEVVVVRDGSPVLPEGWTWKAEGEDRPLVLLRESGPGGYRSLASLVERTMSSCTDVPGWDRILRAGIGPLVDASAFEGAVQFRLPHGRAALASFSSTLVLYILSSAAAPDLVDDLTPEGREENAASALLQEVVRSARPTVVVVGPFDRLVRATRYASPTYEVLRRYAPVLSVADEVLDLRDPGARLKWAEWTLKSAQDHESAVTRLWGGWFSFARRGLWPGARFTVPIGYDVGADGRLSVDPVQQAVVEMVLPMLAEGTSQVQVARELAAGGVLPRRRGTPGSKARHGQAVPTTSQAENTRCSNWVRAFQRQLPDLAQGKFVFTVEQPQTFDAFHPGARLVEDSDGRYSHVVVMDVPDLFGEVAEDVLVQSVRRAMHMRVRCGLPPSAWSVERAVRDDLAARVEAGRPLGRVERGWAGPGGELVDAMGGGQSHRPWVTDMAREVGAGVSVDEPSPSRNPVARPLIGYPGWVADGKEYRFTSGGWGYVLMSREVDPSVSARVSLARGWLTQSRMAHTRVAAFRTTDLHGAVAEAILDVLDGPGAPYLSRSHVLTDLVDVQERGAGVSTVVTRQGLLVGLNAASARVRTATAHAHAVQEYAPAIDSPVAERAHARSVDMALADLQDAYEDEIRAQSALVDFDAPPRATPGPAQEPVPDAERVASVLARLARADVVERRIGHALRTVIRTLMITEVAEFSATGIVTLDVPQHEGEDIKVGPITFVVPLVMPRHVPGKARARSRARAFLTGTATMEQLKPYRARGQATRTLFKSMADA